MGQRARKLGTTGQTGVVRFVGEVDGRPGVWVGVEWDELGLGDTSGELHGRRYFTCSLRGQKVGNAASFLRESELFVSGVCPRSPGFSRSAHERTPRAQSTWRAQRTRRWWWRPGRMCTTGL